MPELIPLSRLTRDYHYDLGSEHYDPTGATAYGAGGEKIGKVVDAYAEDGGQLRYLDVEVGHWYASKQVLLPVGLARFDDADHAVYFDTLTREQVGSLHASDAGTYDETAQVADERVLRAAQAPSGGAATTTDGRDDLYKTPSRLQLLEERLLVNKEKYLAGRVEVGKHVETQQQNVGVDLQREEVVIERHPVEGSRPVEGNVALGSDAETLRVDLEAERASVQKQAFVTEEVEIGKRSETERQTVSETVGKEVLDVNKTGEVDIEGTDAVPTTRDDPSRSR